MKRVKRFLLRSRVRMYRARIRWMRRLRALWVWMLKPIRILARWWIKRRVNGALRVLDAVDLNMQRNGWTRTERRQFWNDFKKHRAIRTETFTTLVQK